MFRLVIAMIMFIKSAYLLVSCNAAVRVEYFPPEPTVIAPEGIAARVSTRQIEHIKKIVEKNGIRMMRATLWRVGPQCFISRSDFIGTN
jgi:hypothetical protein